jgi:hypothetical protein
MSKSDTLEKRIEGLEELLTLSIRVGESHISRLIRDTIYKAERELQIQRVKEQKTHTRNSIV